MRAILRLIRRLFGVLACLVLLALLAVGGLLWFSLPQRGDATPHIPGLTAPVEVVLDADGIPRIHAASALDAAATLGWLHARERMFQMELMRRNASGRLAELFGPAALPLDRMMRVLGLRRRATQDLEALDPDARAMLAAYARGVNARIAERGRLIAPEFLAFGPPEPWSEVDSLLWGKTMQLWLASNYRTELARLALLQDKKLDPAMILRFWPDAGGAGHPEARLAGPHVATAAPMRLPPGFPDPFTQPDRASNEWAVDGAHSATGAPLLAGDPHLAFDFPGLWYLARIDTPQGTLAGATAPGMPFLVLGHNGRIAWSFTTNPADTEDIFIEHVLPDGRYATPDGPAAFSVHEERIRIRGQADAVLRVRDSRHGPVISDLDATPRPDGTVLALQAAMLAAKDTAAAGLLALNNAGSVEEAGRAAPRISAPVQNLLVADHDRIALFTTGHVPLRRAGDGSLPQDGADGAHDWTGFASGSDLPFLVAPASGRLVNANERSAPADFPVFMGRDSDGDWRARRIRALLDATPRPDLADFTRMQLDVTSSFAQQVLPALRALPPVDGVAGQAAALLRGWDGSMAEDLPQPMIFNAWVQQFYALLLRRTGALRATAPWASVVADALGPDAAFWCGGDCAELLRQAQLDSTAALAQRFGQDPTAWRWGDVHLALFNHPLVARLPLIGPLGVISTPVPGSATTVFVGADGQLFDKDAARLGMQSRHGPAYRGVYDLSALDRSRFIVAPGQSGNLLSRHSRDMLERWRTGGTVLLDPHPVAIEQRIVVEP